MGAFGASGTGVLVGIHAVIMDGAAVGARAFIDANSFVRSGFEVPPGILVAGTRAQIVRPLTEAEMAWKANGAKVHEELAVGRGRR
jgi:phenylacetic acid degradation protein